MSTTALNWPSLVDEAIRRRKAEGLSQRALAALAGVSVPTVNAFEKGSTKLRFDGVVAILTALGLYDAPADPAGVDALVASSRAAAEARSPLPSFGYTEFAFALESEARAAIAVPLLKGVAADYDLLTDAAGEVSFESRQNALLFEAAGAEPLRRFELKASGQAYLLRAYSEDAPPSLHHGKLFDVSLPILRAAAFLRAAAAVARTAGGDEKARLSIRFRFAGLAGRTLVAWVDPLLQVDAGGVARSDVIELAAENTVERIETDLAALIAELLAPLYGRFEGFVLSAEFVAAQLGISAQREGVSIGPFSVAKEMVARLGDEDLRSLLGKLLEAEARARGIGTEAIGLGGNQTARDGGIDALIRWKGHPAPGGSLPARTIYMQCKATTMRAADIDKEMRPKGAARPIFAELAAEKGAYLIISTDDPGTKALEARVAAMEAALSGLRGAENIHLDFLGADRLARWTNQHVGVALWLLARAGRPLLGWKPLGSWSSADADGHGYLIDDNSRALVNGNRQEVRDAMMTMRATLSLPGSAVRLVGMSGMGKTRLAEALFDQRLPAGTALNPSLAIYADAGLELATGPAAMAEHLVLSGVEAVLVVDNCTGAAHRQLSAVVRSEGSRVRLLTIDYDVGDDQPEDTLVVKLEANSEILLSEILKQRAPQLNAIDRAHLADFSGGNARIAVGLARSFAGGGDAAKLNDEQLLDRLFQKGRGLEDSDTRRAAEVGSLVYAFYIAASEQHAAEHGLLAEQAGIPAERFYEHMSVLLDWGVVQQRGPQRAVLPPPLANRLAASYLKRADTAALLSRFVAGPVRLLGSFARRLGQLHAEPKAVAIVAAMMAKGAPLGDLAAMDEIEARAFAYAAPANPEAALAVVERANTNVALLENKEAASETATLLAHIAHDPALFARAMRAMLPFALAEAGRADGDEVQTLFLERFRPVLSMTLADAADRLKMLDELLESGQAEVRSLGVEALDHMLEIQAHSSFDPEWGVQTRSSEWRPRLPVDEAAWFEGAFSRLQGLIAGGGALAERARSIIAQHMREHCDRGLARLILPEARTAKPSGYWDAGWRAAVETLQFSDGDPAPAWRADLTLLEQDLRPKTLAESFEAFVLGEPWRHWIARRSSEKRYTRNVALLAKAVGVGLVRAGIDPEPFIARTIAAQGQNSTLHFGEGLARASAERDALWTKARDLYLAADPGDRDVGVLIGILQQYDRADTGWGDARLDEIAADEEFSKFLVFFHGGRDLGVADVDRFSIALGAGRVTPGQLGALMFGGRTKSIPAAALAGLLVRMIAAEDGLAPAREILSMRLYGDRQDKVAIAPELIAVAKTLLTDPRFYGTENARTGHEAAGLLRHVLDLYGEAGATEICRAMKEADTESRYWSDSDWQEFVGVLTGRFLRVILDEFGGLLPKKRRRRRYGSLLALFLGGSISNDVDGRIEESPLDADVALAWASESPDDRAPLLAEHVGYAQKTPEDKEGVRELTWSDIALRLIDLAPDPAKLLGNVERRFYSGVSTGAFWMRFERRRPMITALLAHRDKRVREWASEALVRLDEQIAYWKDREDERESLFE
ncbi:MAG: helix-turn-helix domain-containing protein [Sphingopyxis sp.]|uniref:helix-turn-helix domain-containing protein n=1 Tax=Sphingopyxis sp. TaxID=1908224 RepID=UPI003D6D416E